MDEEPIRADEEDTEQEGSADDPIGNSTKSHSLSAGLDSPKALGSYSFALRSEKGGPGPAGLGVQNVFTADAQIAQVTGTTSLYTRLGDAGDLVTVRHRKRRSTYYSLTKEEIDSYAQFGTLASVMLTLFGAAIGATITAWAALLQGGVDPASEAVFRTILWLTAAVALVFLVLACFFFLRNWRTKQAWEQEPEETG